MVISHPSQPFKDKFNKYKDFERLQHFYRADIRSIQIVYR